MALTYAWLAAVAGQRGDAAAQQRMEMLEAEAERSRLAGLLQHY
jgi:hypothetical protein